MTVFSQNLLLSEVAKLVTNEVTPVRSGGVLHSGATHSQIMDIVSTTFTMDPYAILYLAKLVKNRLQRQVVKEVEIIEALLVSLQYIGRSGKVSVNVTNLKNAKNALLGLDAATSVRDRPELSLYLKYMSRFAEEVKETVVDDLGGLGMSGEEARRALRLDLDTLKRVHSNVLRVSQNLIDLLDTYNSLDIPSRVSKTTVTNALLSNQEMTTLLSNGTDAEKEARRKGLLARALTDKAVVNAIVGAQGPQETKFDSGEVGATPGEATGEGEAAYALSNHGPWQLPFSADLVLKIDGGSNQTVALTSAWGTQLVGNNTESFTFNKKERDLYITTDPNQYTVMYYDDVPTAPNIGPDYPVAPLPSDGSKQRPGHMIVKVEVDFYVPLGYKHLGAPISPSEDFQYTFGVVKKNGWMPSLPGILPLPLPPTEWAWWWWQHMHVLKMILKPLILAMGGWDVMMEVMFPESADRPPEPPETLLAPSKSIDSLWPAIVTDFARLATMNVSSWSGDRVTVTGFSSESGLYSSFSQEDVGRYFKTLGGGRYEILEYIDADTVRVDLRGNSAFTGSVELRGSDGPSRQLGLFWDSSYRYMELDITPELPVDPRLYVPVKWYDPPLPSPSPSPPPVWNPLYTPLTKHWADKEIRIGPFTKSHRLPIGVMDAASVVSSINSGVSAIPYPHNEGARLSSHFFAVTHSQFPGKPVIRARSKYYPFARVDSQAIDPLVARGATSTIYGLSAGLILGLKPGAKDEGDYYEPKELVELVNSSVVGAKAEVATTDIVSNLACLTVPGTANVSSPTADFVAAGVAEWMWVDLTAGTSSGRYLVDSVVDATTISLKRLPFTRKEDGTLGVTKETVKITSNKKGLGSKIEIVSSPLTHTVVPEPGLLQFETFTPTGAKPGDKVLIDPADGGESVEAEVASVEDNGTTLNLTSPIPSGTSGDFKVEDDIYARYRLMRSRLTTILTTRDYLALHGFNVNLDYLDSVLSPIVSTGKSTAKARATDLLKYLLEIFTSQANRTSEHHVTPDQRELTILTTLQDYDSITVTALDNVLDGLDERGMDRGVDLLLDGDISGFYDTTEDTASYGGKFLNAAKNVRNDLPTLAQNTHLVAALANIDNFPVENFDSKDVLEEVEPLLDDSEVFLE